MSKLLEEANLQSFAHCYSLLDNITHKDVATDFTGYVKFVLKFVLVQI